MIEIIEKATGKSLVYGQRKPLDVAQSSGVPALLVLNLVHRSLSGGIEPVLTDGGLRFSIENERYCVRLYHGRIGD
jgi:hypothetical protein